jgi:hypothetical protein
MVAGDGLRRDFLPRMVEFMSHGQASDRYNKIMMNWVNPMYCGIRLP